MRNLIPVFLMALSSVAFADVSPNQEPAQKPAKNPMMVIEPKMRALDYQQAFESLRKERTASKVFFQLTDGSTLTNVIELTVMGNGTLLLFKTNTPQGIKHQVVEVERIQSICHL